MRKIFVILTFFLLVGQSEIRSQDENKLLDCVPQHVLNQVDHMKFFGSDESYLGYTRNGILLNELSQANATNAWVGYIDENSDGIYDIWEVSAAPQDTEYYGRIIISQFPPNQYSHASNYPIYFWKSGDTFFVMPFGISISVALADSPDGNIHPVNCSLYEVKVSDLQNNFDHFEYRISVQDILENYYD